jgi:hypothetical protein
VGGSFAFAALGALVEAARELLDGDLSEIFERAKVGRYAAQQAFSERPETW